MESQTSIADTRPVPSSFESLQDGPPSYASVNLTGWFERNGFGPILSAFILFIASFVAFQGLATLVAIGLLIAQNGIPDSGAVLEILENATGPLLAGNTVGQFIGMGLLVLLWTRLHTRESGAFLRISAPDPVLLGLSIVGLFSLLPFIQWLGQINEMLPLPGVLEELERAQIALIERVLGGDIGLFSSIFALAITPAICEELLFRGYLQRQFERSLGVVGGILLTGALFGLYHFRLSQALPLAVLGIYLGYLVWRTGSLWVVIAIHFLNNGFAIAANKVVSSSPDLNLDELEAIPVPITAVVGSVAVFALVVVFINRRVRALPGRTPEGENHDE